MADLRWSRRSTLAIVLALCAGIVAVGARASWASEAILQDRTVSEAAAQGPGVLERAFEERVERETLFPRLKSFLEHQPPFVRGSSLTAHVRTYYLGRHNLDSSANEAWAAGGWLRYRSGWLLETFRIGGTLYTSQPLYAPPDRDGTGLLAAGQAGYAVLGEAFAQVRYGDHRLTGYRQLLDLPYVNGEDSRMTPNTFQGVTLFGRTPWLRYGAGYVSDMKKRNADEFVAMGEAAGVSDGDQGLAFATLRTGPWRGLSIGVVNHVVPNVLNILYAEADYVWRPASDLTVALGAQFTDQRSVGDDRLTGSFFATQVGGARAEVRYAGAMLTMAVSTTASGADIRNPFGSYPGDLSLMETNFNRASEEAWLIGLAYDFGRVGLPGLSAFLNFAQGTGARDPTTGQPSPDERELDLTVDYRVTRREWLEGFWLRLRGAVLESNGRTQTEIRLILHYAFPVL